MGNEGSHDFRDDSGVGDFENAILPPMVLLIDNVIWRADSIGCAIQDDATIKVVALLDGWEIGQPVSFPSAMFPSLPISRVTKKLIPKGPGSVLKLVFSTESGAAAGTTGEISMPLSKLIHFGVPLCTTLWLALPFEAGIGLKYDMSEALARGSNPELSKVVLSVFRPSYKDRNEELQPDVHGVLAEDTGMGCTGPVKTGPTAITQIKGLIKGMRSMSLALCAMQRECFNRDRSPNPFQSHKLSAPGQQFGAVNDRLVAQVRSLEMQLESRGDELQDVSPFATSDLQVARLQEMLEQVRCENTVLQVEKAKSQEKIDLQETHWRERLESQGKELKSLRSIDVLQSQELDRRLHELNGFQDMRDGQDKTMQEIEKVQVQLEELEVLKSQVQTHKAQQRYLERELNLANEELQRLRDLDEQRKSITQNHAELEDELGRSQANLGGVHKELAEAREDLKVVPSLEKQVQYLEVELKLSKDKNVELSSEIAAVQEELARAKATAEAVAVEKAGAANMYEEQLARNAADLEALRARDYTNPARGEEVVRMQVELESLRMEKQKWKEALEADCHRWNNELEALRIANERQVELQDELAAKSMELEALKMSASSRQVIEDEIVRKNDEVESTNQAEVEVLQETLEKMKAAAPKRLKDLREECAALREKDKERVALKEQVKAMSVENSKQVDEIKDLKETERKSERRLQETTEDLDRKKSALLNVRAEREVLRTGEVLRQELVDDNLSMKEELDKLKQKDASTRKELNELRGASGQQKSDRSGVQTV
jgi:chromosome segregation ATPase